MYITLYIREIANLLLSILKLFYFIFNLKNSVLLSISINFFEDILFETSRPEERHYICRKSNYRIAPVSSRRRTCAYTCDISFVVVFGKESRKRKSIRRSTVVAKRATCVFVIRANLARSLISRYSQTRDIPGGD